MVAFNSTEVIKAQNLLNYLTKASGFVSLKEILETFNISRRTAFNWLNSTNKILRENNLDEIVNIPNYGYKITDRTKRELNSNHEIIKSVNQSSMSSTDRRTTIILLLMSESKDVSINKLSTRFECSRNTIIKDFKAINDLFPNLKIVSSRLGHKIASDEASVRITMYELLLHQNKVAHTFIKNLDYSMAETQQAVVNIQKKLHISFSGNSIQQLTYLLVFTQWRIANKKLINDSSNLQWIADNTDNVLATCEELLNFLTKQKIEAAEVVFISKIVLCSQATEVDCVNKNLYRDLDNIAQEIIFRYEQLTEQQISYNLFTKVLRNHLYATFFRVKFDIPYTSSEVDEIKKQYPELIKFTAIACAPLEQYLNKKLPDSEIALICLYFGSVNAKGYQDFSNVDKLKRASLAEVLVVCSSGIGTSAMLYQKLSKMYPLIKFSLPLEIKDLCEIFKHNYQARLIISTAILPSSKYPIPVVNVKAVLTKSDQNLVEKYLQKEMPNKIGHNTSAVNNLVSIINEYADVKDEKGLRLSLDRFISPEAKQVDKRDLPSLMSLLPERRIKLIHNDGSLNWKDVLQTGCKLLEKDQVIDDHYFEKIVKLIDQYGPYMLISENIFLAHAAPSESNKNIGLSLIALDQEIEIASRNQHVLVTCIFVLSPGLKREHEKALEQLIDIVRNKNNVSCLVNAKSSKEIRRFLLSFC